MLKSDGSLKGCTRGHPNCRWMRSGYVLVLPQASDKDQRRWMVLLLIQESLYAILSVYMASPMLVSQWSLSPEASPVIFRFVGSWSQEISTSAGGKNMGGKMSTRVINCVSEWTFPQASDNDHILWIVPVPSQAPCEVSVSV